MKKKLFAIAFAALALISCEKDNSSDSQQNEGYIPVKEQENIISSSVQQALQGYDMSSFIPVMEDFLQLLNEPTKVAVLVDSVTSNPDFVQWVKSNSDSGSKMNLSIQLDDSLPPTVTFAATQNEEHNIDIIHNVKKTNIRLGWWGQIDTTRIPDKIHFSIKRNDNPAMDMTFNITAPNPSEGITAILETAFGDFKQKLGFDFYKKLGVDIMLSAYNHDNLLADFDIRSDFDLSTLQGTDKNHILAWLMDYEQMRSISVAGGIKNRRVSMEASLSNPFKDPHFVSAVMPLMDADSIPVEKVGELYNMLIPFTNNGIRFEGYAKPQASFSLFGKDGFDATGFSLTAGKYETLAKIVGKLIDALKTKESMIVISTVMSLYPSAVAAIQQETGGDIYIHVPESDQNKEQYIPIWEYFDKDAVKGLISKPIATVFEEVNVERLIYSVMSIYPMVVQTIKKNLNIEEEE